MNIKKLIIIFFISFLITSCQTIKEKSDAVAEKENQEYGKFVGKNITELKIELGNPTEDFIGFSLLKVGFMYEWLMNNKPELFAIKF